MQEGVEMNVKIDNLASEIMKGLEDYSKMASDELKSEVKKAAKNIKQDIKDTAPVGRTGRYAKSWTVKNNRETSNSIELIVHSRDRYQLAHLLEKGHVLRQGGRVKAKPHIAPAEEKGVRELEENLIRKLKNG
jgi:hypothetical protein